MGVHYVVIAGEDDLQQEQASVRDLIAGGQEGVPIAQFFEESMRGSFQSRRQSLITD